MAGAAEQFAAGRDLGRGVEEASILLLPVVAAALADVVRFFEVALLFALVLFLGEPPQSVLKVGFRLPRAG